MWLNLPQRLDQLASQEGQVDPLDNHFFEGHGDFQCGDRKLELAMKCFLRIKFEGKILFLKGPQPFQS